MIHDEQGSRPSPVDGVGVPSAGESAEVWRGRTLTEIRERMQAHVSYYRSDWAHRIAVNHIRVVVPDDESPFILSESEIQQIGIEQLKTNYFSRRQSYGVVARVWLPTGRESAGSEVSPLAPSEFWRLIEDGGSTPGQRLSAILSSLRRLDTDSLSRFAESLARLMWQLDSEAIHERWNRGELDGDGFMYARSAVVLRGRDAFASELTSSRKRRFSDTDLHLGERLIVALWDELSLRGVDVTTSVSMESMMNTSQWGLPSEESNWPGWLSGRFIAFADDKARIVEYGISAQSSDELPEVEERLLGVAKARWPDFSIVGYEIYRPESSISPFRPIIADPYVSYRETEIPSPPTWEDVQSRFFADRQIDSPPFRID
ncbi:DUF4240 domain-containing protein [Gryllotalpicola ginsengisoli]|uniref:DUF4240 domain-containing protein n=1 Tax=Gryllotalpicola ginsengisoli TaxID=444608 RepID=UPI00138AE914|nr:DUF4240 domain-containing protein [Gryllotalpicola ginsengisoli]